MLTLRKAAILSVACVLATGSLAWGQATFTMTAGTAAPAKASPILDVVPAGTLGFVAVQNVGKSLTAAQDYVKEIGVADLAPLPPDFLAALKEAAQLGDGFNADGGFAAALLDPQPFGIDFLKMLKEDRSSTGPADSNKPKVPFVLFVPASNLKDLFGKYEMKPEGDLTRIALRMGEMYGAMMGGYAVVSPNAQAVQAVLKADKKASSELSKEVLTGIVSSDVAVHVNFKASFPILKGLLDFAAQKTKVPATGPMFSAQKMSLLSPDQGFALLTKMLVEFRELTFTLQFAKPGVLFQEYVSVDPSGAMGKAMAALKPDEKAGLDRLPDLPYVLAIGALSGVKGPWNKEIMEMMVKALPGLSDATRAKIVSLQQDMESQITGAQIALGGAPEGAGVFGVDVVVSCNDSAKVKGLLGDTVDTITAIIAGLSGNEESPLKVTYVKDAEKLDSVSLDAINITHPKFADLGEDEKAAMKKVLGEDKIRLLVAAPDDKTVVVTFGGGTAMMAEALKVAKGGGKIPADPGVVEAMKVMPKNPRALVMLDASHLMAVAAKAAEALGAADKMPPIQITCKTPIAVGAGVSADSVHEVILIPTDLVKDIVNVVKAFAGGVK